MFRKTTGAILCPSCRRLTNADAPVCLVCGRRNPGLWGFAGPLGALFRGRRSFSDVVTVLCVALFVISLVVDPRAAFQAPSGLNLFAPSVSALIDLGATGAAPWRAGRWWTLVTAIYLHGGLLHLVFNVLWIRQLGPAVEELYGPARLVVIFTVAGVAGFLVSSHAGVLLTVGASGSIFGLLGAMVAFGRKRGGTFGTLVLRQYGQWAVLLFVLGFLMPHVDNFAHAGGFVGGLATGLVLSSSERAAETGAVQLAAVVAGGLTLLGFGLAVWTALSGT